MDLYYNHVYSHTRRHIDLERLGHQRRQVIAFEDVGGRGCVFSIRRKTQVLQQRRDNDEHLEVGDATSDALSGTWEAREYRLNVREQSQLNEETSMRD